MPSPSPQARGVSAHVESLAEGRNALVTLTDGTFLDYDVYLPCYMQGPNTAFLAGSGALDAGNRIVANECLQSKSHPEMFGVNTTDQPSEVTQCRVACQRKARHVLPTRCG